MKNIQAVTLAYVTRNNPDPSGIVIDREQDILQNYPLQVNMFPPDTKNVLWDYQVANSRYWCCDMN